MQPTAQGPQDPGSHRPVIVAAGLALLSLAASVVPPAGFYLAVLALLTYLWARRRGDSGSRPALFARVFVALALGVGAVSLLLGIGLCGPRLLVFVCDA